MRPQFSQRPRRLYGAELQPVTVLATLSLCTGTVCLRSWTLPSTIKLRMSLFSCCLQIMRMYIRMYVFVGNHINYLYLCVRVCVRLYICVCVCVCVCACMCVFAWLRTHIREYAPRSLPFFQPLCLGRGISKGSITTTRTRSSSPLLVSISGLSTECCLHRKVMRTCFHACTTAHGRVDGWMDSLTFSFLTRNHLCARIHRRSRGREEADDVSRGARAPV